MPKHNAAAFCERIFSYLNYPSCSRKTVRACKNQDCYFCTFLLRKMLVWTSTKSEISVLVSFQMLQWICGLYKLDLSVSSSSSSSSSFFLFFILGRGHKGGVQTWEDREVSVIRVRDVKFPNNQQKFTDGKQIGKIFYRLLDGCFLWHIVSFIKTFSFRPDLISLFSCMSSFLDNFFKVFKNYIVWFDL